VIEAAMIWNEPNNKSHWDPEVDPDWSIFAETMRAAGEAIRAENPALPRVMGGMSPIDPLFVENMAGKGALDAVDVVAVHGFPLDWNLWSIHDWPAKLDEIRAVTPKPVWVSEVGVSTFGAEEVQVFGLKRTAELLIGRAPRFTGIASTTSPAPGPPPPATRRPRAPPTTATSTWACSARTAPRSWPPPTSAR
jgi:beta-xylosidase